MLRQLTRPPAALRARARHLQPAAHRDSKEGAPDSPIRAARGLRFGGTISLS